MDGTPDTSNYLSRVFQVLGITMLIPLGTLANTFASEEQITWLYAGFAIVSAIAGVYFLSRGYIMIKARIEV